MGKVQEILIGHRTFAVDIDWKDGRKSDAISCDARNLMHGQKMDHRLPTKNSVCGQTPHTPLAWRATAAGQYKVLSVEAVRMAETRPDLQTWRQTRIDKKRTMDKFFEIPSL
ncbi:hypothetical protein [Klebsiella pneumoniae]|uniref:hypothetical protein n=1 Tax=Klebsiella pneumoniae TaxID=573 RepID=UPI001D18E738|nr:hypothetical protein [Klebsiella pneumoniae]